MTVSVIKRSHDNAGLTTVTLKDLYDQVWTVVSLQKWLAHF